MSEGPRIFIETNTETNFQSVLEKGLRPQVLAINVSKFLPASRCSKRQLGTRSQKNVVKPTPNNPPKTLHCWSI